jgi:hypothetical protein
MCSLGLICKFLVHCAKKFLIAFVFSRYEGGLTLFPVRITIGGLVNLQKPAIIII